MSGEPLGNELGSRTRRRSLFARPAFAAVVLLAAIGLIQLWLFSCGRMWSWPKDTIYYPVLADAFMHGQVTLRVQPRPELLALPDPYDPAANQSYRWHDAVLFSGKYYLYWGPVPALIEAAICFVLGIGSPDIGDQQIACVFVFSTVVMATILLVQVKEHLFPNLGAAAILPAVLTLGLGAPALRIGGVYGAAIAGGQFFLLAGVCAAWFGLARGRARPLWLMAAGECWALSAGSRGDGRVYGLAGLEDQGPVPDDRGDCADRAADRRGDFIRLV
jgi:hypothetical protein